MKAVAEASSILASFVCHLDRILDDSSVYKALIELKNITDQPLLLSDILHIKRIRLLLHIP